jgi:DNA-nicking Smr family endonuclease
VEAHVNEPLAASPQAELQKAYSGERDGMSGDWTDRAPDAVFDLHGQSAMEAGTNAERFLRAQARARPSGVVRIVTGRGRGGGGAPIRTRVRALLRAQREPGGVVADYFLEDTEGSFLIRLR